MRDREGFVKSPTEGLASTAHVEALREIASSPYPLAMDTSIRIATRDDADGVARFFGAIYASQRGLSSASAREMLARTVAVLFPQRDGPTVMVYVIEDDIHGVVAYHVDQERASASIVSVQAHDTVRGRSAAQQLLSETARSCAEAGVTLLVTDVPAADVRARGFLRREGFSAVVENDAVSASQDDAVVTYQRLLSEESAADA